MDLTYTPPGVRQFEPRGDSNGANFRGRRSFDRQSFGSCKLTICAGRSRGRNPGDGRAAKEVQGFFGTAPARRQLRRSRSRRLLESDFEEEIVPIFTLSAEMRVRYEGK